MRSLQQHCSECLSVLPTPYLLSIHLAEQHDSFFASQAAQRMNVFRCLVEGCSSTFSSAAQRRQHLLDLHQIPLESCFDRIHLTLNQGQIRPSDNPARSKSDKSKPEPACEQPAVAPQVDTFVSTAVADASGAPTSSLSQSTDEHQATDAARQCNACLKAEDVAAGSPLQHPDTEQSPAQPHLPQYSKAPQTNQQTADGSSVQLDEPGGKHMAPHEKKSKGGRGAPLGGSGRGRGWGRHRVTLG
ncbi:hypothetical protein ABBQ38_005914 [Trebouxia sp. C0009 RCD-2024]